MMAIPASRLDLRPYIREHDRILLGQGTAEPRTLTEVLMAQAGDLPACRVFLGPTYSETFSPDAPEHLTFESYGAIGKAARLARAGRLEIYPTHFSALAEAIASRRLPVDGVMLPLRPSPDGRGYNLGIGRDIALMAARQARYVLAEISPWLPLCHGGEIDDDLPLAALVEAEYPPIELPQQVPDETEQAVARNVAAIIPDGAVLQIGVGALPAAVLSALKHHRDLGFHSGAAIDGLVDLAESGALTNRRKERDTGISVAGLLLGSRRLYDYADRNPAIRLAGPEVTHAAQYIAGLSRFHAINSALAVDLTGQVAAEEVDGRYVGAVGGQGDFTRAAALSPGGRSIIALPSTTRSGESRIVPRASVITTARSDVDTVVTEHGVAELRYCSLNERVRRMIAIAAPEWREPLARAWRDGKSVIED